MGIIKGLLGPNFSWRQEGESELMSVDLVFPSWWQESQVKPEDLLTIGHATFVVGFTFSYRLPVRVRIIYALICNEIEKVMVIKMLNGGGDAEGAMGIEGEVTLCARVGVAVANVSA